MFSRVARYYHTLRYLQWIQIKYRLLKPWKKIWISLLPTALPKTKPSKDLHLNPSIPALPLWQGGSTFELLNIRHEFTQSIDWNYAAYGKLWTYNLTYFEYLSQSNLPVEKGLELIDDFIKQEKNIRDGMEPFPISLRLIFWIKFLIQHQIKEARIDASLLRQLKRLSALPEYHLLGNHLLENAFGLLFGAVYFGQASYLQQAEKILMPQLQEQVLPDGGHFERSPMYQQILLYRILDSLNLLQNNASQVNPSLQSLLREKAASMLGWLAAIDFSNGTTPRLNDTAPGIAPRTSALQAYAQRLGLSPQPIKLGESGYRKFSQASYEAIIDVGAIGPDYIPGHAHSDTFNIVVHHRGQALLVDTGISTYEKNATRTLERSTAAHNTVRVEGLEQSEVWGGFRVARRARITQLEESEGGAKASHDGYQRIGCIHQRQFTFGEKSIVLQDDLSDGKRGEAYFHFHPDCKVTLEDAKISGEFGSLTFSSAQRIHLEPYAYAAAFNQTLQAQKVVVAFKQTLQTKINLS